MTEDLQYSIHKPRYLLTFVQPLHLGKLRSPKAQGKQLQLRGGPNTVQLRVSSMPSCRATVGHFPFSVFNLHHRVSCAATGTNPYCVATTTV